MREKEYSQWLKSRVTDAVIRNYIKRCQRIEYNLNIDLDEEFKKDKGVSLLAKLVYTTDDQLQNRALKCDLFFNAGSDLRNGMASLKSAVSVYFEFCWTDATSKETTYHITNHITKDIGQQNPKVIVDSYQEFLSHFGIDKQSFFEWGLSATIFPPVSQVELEWDALKKRIQQNQTVYIRGYGRDAGGTQLYMDLYKALFNHFHVEKDPTNNAQPHKLIQRLTGRKRNCDIYNYQVTHIWGHTKNIFLFENPWNICYTPKIMDPLTGHEAQGSWPAEYQKLFISKAYELYKPFIEDYNQILKEYDVEKRTQEYILSLKGIIPEKKLSQFAKDATIELSSIVSI